MSKSKIIALTGLIITVFLLASFTQAVAATMKFRIVMFHTKVEAIEVGDVEGHKLLLGESTGLASLETGVVAVIAVKWTADYAKETAIAPGYQRMTFEDGSTIDVTFLTKSRPGPKGKGRLFESTYEINKGSGKYVGIQGNGTSTGRRVAPLGAGAQLYFDVIMTYTLP